MRNLRISTYAAVLGVMMLAATTAPQAAEVRLKPYLLAEQAPCTPATFGPKVAAVREALQGAGFEIVGETAPNDGAHVFIITNETMKQNAAASRTGGFGAAQRVAVTRVGDQVQVSSTNPMWMANVYQMRGELTDVSTSLQKALGIKEEFGSKDGLTAKQLRTYHYMMFMPHFTEQVTLAEYASHAEALSKVEAGIAASTVVKKVARIDVPGADETLFAVTIASGDGADAAVMKITDVGAIKHTAYLTYELLISGKKALMLHGKFRIAQSFPDLSMRTFMKISGAPDGIEKALRDAVK
ncbi:MAG: hypothetical protein WCQ64_15065 [Acidobacteriota bacterium]